jgi:hypothetical protein
MVVEFLVEEEHFVRGKEDVSIWEQVANAVVYQKFWADNQVSITVSFKEEERDDIKHTLELYEDSLKGISFLPLSDAVYPQMPYESISEEVYRERVKDLKEIDLSAMQHQGESPRGCDGDTCTI